MKEAAIHRRALYDPHRSRVRIGENRLRSLRRRYDGAEPPRNVVECFIPGDALEVTLSLSADSLEWMQQAFRVVGALQVAIYLGTEKSLRKRMVRIALDTDSAAALDGDQGGAGVGTVVRATTSNDYTLRFGF